ncbi:unnamed protein product [Closterium sp. NIES-54]
MLPTRTPAHAVAHANVHTGACHASAHQQPADPHCLCCPRKRTVPAWLVILYPPACGPPAALCNSQATPLAACAPPLAACSPPLAARLPPPLQPVHYLAAANPIPCTTLPCPASFPSARVLPCLRADQLWLLSVSSRVFPLTPSYASAAAIDVPSAEDVGAASASGKRRSSKGKGGRSGGGGSGGGSGGSSRGGGGSGGGGSGGSGGGSGGLGVGGGGSDGSGGSGGGGSGGSRGGACGASGGSVSCPYVIRTGDRAGQTCEKPHTQHRCFSRLDDTWRAEFGDEAEHPRWAELLRSVVDIFDLDYDAILAAMYALSVSAEGECYLCVPPDSGIEVATLGASVSALSGTASAEALHTFTLDSGASRCFFRSSTTLTPLSAPVPVRLADPSGGSVLARSSTVLPCPAVPSGSLSGLHLPSFSTNLVSTTALQDAMVTTTTPGGQRVLICKCTRTGHHLATFSCRLWTSLYTLATEPPQVSASGPVAPPCSCRLLSHQTLLWHHRLGHPSLPRLCRMHSRLLVVTEFQDNPALEQHVTAVERTENETRSTGGQVGLYHPPFEKFGLPRSSLQEGAIRLQLCELFRQDLPFLRLHSDRGGEFSSDLLRDFCRGKYDAHQLNLWPRVSLPETSPTLRWTGQTAPSGVSQVDPLPGTVPVEVADGSGAARGAVSGDVERGGAESEGAGYGVAEPGGAEPAGVEPWGAEPAGAEPGGAECAGAESRGAEPRCTASFGAGGTGGAAAAGLGGARTRGTGAAVTGSVGGALAGGAADGDLAEPGDPGAVGARAGGTRAGGTRAGGAGAGGAVSGGTGARGTVRPRPFFVPLLWQVLGLPSSAGLTPPLLCPPPDQSQPTLQPASPLPAPSPYTEQTGGLKEHREPALSSTFGRVRRAEWSISIACGLPHRLLRYLYSTSGMGLVLEGLDPVVLTGHADASWVDDSATQRLSKGYTFRLGSGSVSWRSTRSSSVLSSSREAEIYAGAMAVEELRWLTYLVTDLGEQPHSPPVLYVDNKAMIALCQEHRLEHRTNHIALRYFLARELQQRG